MFVPLFPLCCISLQASKDSSPSCSKPPLILFGYDPALCLSVCPAPPSLYSISSILQRLSFSRFPPLLLASDFCGLFAHLCPRTCRRVCRFFSANKLRCPDSPMCLALLFCLEDPHWHVWAEVRIPGSSCIQRSHSVPQLDPLSCWPVDPCAARFSVNGWCKLLLVPFRACVARS